jgi:hypothetical protein
MLTQGESRLINGRDDFLDKHRQCDVAGRRVIRPPTTGAEYTSTVVQNSGAIAYNGYLEESAVVA